MAFSVKRYVTIIDDILNYIIANQDKVTDFNEGAVLASECEAFSRIMENLYIDTRVGFDLGLIEVPFKTFDFSRKSGLKASGSVVFSRTGTSGEKPILIGSIVSTPAGLKFITTSLGIIEDGNSDSNSVSIQAEKIGRDYNVPATTITIIYTPVPGVETVSNSSATTSGSNQESNAEFLKRFQEFIEGLGKSNKTGLIAGAKSVTGIRSASIVEHFPPVSSYNLTIYIDDGTGEASQALVDIVKEKLIGEGTEEKPGYKGGGVNLRVLVPTKVTVAVTVEITDDGSVSQWVVEYNADQAISNYINNLHIGEDVILNKIRKVIMSVDGVLDIDITVPANNTSVSDSQIARTGVITIIFV